MSPRVLYVLRMHARYCRMVGPLQQPRYGPVHTDPVRFMRRARGTRR